MDRIASPNASAGRTKNGAGAEERPAGRAPTVRAVQHAVEVLHCLSAAQPDLGVSEIARRVGLHKSSISRLLVTLEEARLVERDPRSDRSRLGIGLVSLAAPLLVNLEVTRIARPYLEALAERSGETVNLSIWDGTQAVSMEQALGASAVKHYAPPGRSNPAHCTASGKALLAHAPVTDLQRLLDRALDPYTERTLIERDKLLAELEQIRREGYALNNCEFVDDVGAVAAVVRNIEGAVVGAVTATVPAFRFGPEQQEKLIAMVRATAAEISQRLGYVGTAGPAR